MTTHLAARPVDEPDLLALIADEHTPLGKPLADAFRDACKAEAERAGSFDGESPAGPVGWVNPNRVRLALLDHPSYEPRQYAGLWSVACSRDGYLVKTVRAQLIALDSQLLVAGERLAKYRVTGPSTSVVVQRGVINRLLDERLVLMKERDRV